MLHTIKNIYFFYYLTMISTSWVCMLQVCVSNTSSSWCILKYIPTMMVLNNINVRDKYQCFVCILLVLISFVSSCVCFLPQAVSFVNIPHLPCGLLAFCCGSYIGFPSPSKVHPPLFISHPNGHYQFLGKSWSRVAQLSIHNKLTFKNNVDNFSDHYPNNNELQSLDSQFYKGTWVVLH